jgi:hypothetical protein
MARTSLPMSGATNLDGSITSRPYNETGGFGVLTGVPSNERWGRLAHPSDPMGTMPKPEAGAPDGTTAWPKPGYLALTDLGRQIARGLSGDSWRTATRTAAGGLSGETGADSRLW